MTEAEEQEERVSRAHEEALEQNATLHRRSNQRHGQGDRRHEDLGRDSRGSRGMYGSMQDNPIITMMATLVTALATGVIGTTVVISRPAAVPLGASSVQIEEVLGQVKSLTLKVSEISGDVRSIKESDLMGRTHANETAIQGLVATVQGIQLLTTERDKETSDRRRNWEDWRKVVDAKLDRLGGSK